MSDTPHIGLPLVMPAQAQKHVTVNEALARIDALMQLTLASRSVTVPPAAAEGDAYAVPTGAVNAWAGREGQVALWLNGGWAFVVPKPGWRGFVVDEGVPASFDGVDWIAGVGAVSASGAATTLRVVEFDHAVGAGATSETAPMIPAQSLLIGVTGRVLTAIGGTAGAWRLGIGGLDDARYGSGLGLGAGAWLRGLTSSPLAYYADTALTLTGEGGDLSGGSVRFALHLAELGLPRP